MNPTSHTMLTSSALIAMLRADRLAEEAHHAALPCVPKWGFWMAARIQAATGVKAVAHSDATIHVDVVLPVEWRRMQQFIDANSKPDA